MITSIFSGTFFDPEIFVKKICSENPNYICIIWWIVCCSDDVNINNAEFYDKQNLETFYEKVDQLLQEFDEPVFKNNQLEIKEWDGDRASSMYEFVNISPEIKKTIQLKIKEYISSDNDESDNDDSDNDESDNNDSDNYEIDDDDSDNDESE